MRGDVARGSASYHTAAVPRAAASARARAKTKRLMSAELLADRFAFRKTICM